MACAATRPTFSFHLSTSFPQSSSPKPIPHFIKLSILHKPHRLISTAHSIDISKEDTPTSSEQPNSPAQEPEESQEKIDKRRLEEKFAVLNTGIYECRSCGHKYDEAVGDPSYPIPPGLQFDKLPEDWRCPTCGAARSFFQSKSVEIAGFAENQKFGLGGNALTSGQKAVLIYGSLLVFFALFLSGYWLQ